MGEPALYPARSQMDGTAALFLDLSGTAGREVRPVRQRPELISDY